MSSIFLRFSPQATYHSRWRLKHRFHSSSWRSQGLSAIVIKPVYCRDTLEQETCDRVGAVFLFGGNSTHNDDLLLITPPGLGSGTFGENGLIGARVRLAPGLLRFGVSTFVSHPSLAKISGPIGDLGSRIDDFRRDKVTKFKALISGETAGIENF